MPKGAKDSPHLKHSEYVLHDNSKTVLEMWEEILSQWENCWSNQNSNILASEKGVWNDENIDSFEIIRILQVNT